MPDWSYHTVFKPVLTRLPDSYGREFIHRGMSLISTIPGGSSLIKNLGHTEPSQKLETSIFGLTISNPVGLSGKIDPKITGTKAFGNLGLGFLEVGPVSIIPNESSSPRFTQERDNLVYSYPLESLGIEETVNKLKELKKFNKPIFIRIGKTGLCEETVSLVETLFDYGDAFILEKRFSDHDLELIKKVLKTKPLCFSFSQSQLDTDYLSNLIRKKYIDGVIIEEQAIDTGSGQMFPLVQVENLTKTIQEVKAITDIPIIVSGGILEPKDALGLFQSGADLVMLSSGYVFSGPGLPKRINEALMSVKVQERTEYKGWIWHWLFGLIMLFGGLLALLISMTVIVLPYDEAFLQLTREQLMAINPNIIRFMQHDRMTLAGTMISGGFLYMRIARYGVRYGMYWAKKSIHTAGIVGFLGILLFIGFGYFDWLHGLLWLMLLPFFWIGYRTTRNFAEHPTSSNRTNHSAWKKGLWGQFAFVILGFSFILGGFVISTIGVTGVFVPTDLIYICMTPDQLNDINNRLIPVIAHDRAGLGSSLISVGLLVLMLALWSFQQGEKWVWYTFLIGGIPAFSAGIFIHFAIGYISFIHILPAYFALLLFVIGLVLSKDFFLKGK
ncbi:dihydroorotate dehydrogenase [Paenisporosarcina sp. OV554]|uniref:dihydroorotate dehydrogenase n=1 Tax=Paenisporosarcina sp. OV554 TaxID=2135694 RepID=UPI000D392376|nr:dihydroorotate dehydrogenase [Paenisporosarcina sp. OV554]PUB11441.1 dihydroorotate dehydrogenase [Paenisporosarcina sp. OV554]